MEKMVVLVMLAFSIGILAGEGIRDTVDGERIEGGVRGFRSERIPGRPQLRQGKKWKLYSGLFILLKQKIDLPV